MAHQQQAARRRGAVGDAQRGLPAGQRDLLDGARERRGPLGDRRPHRGEPAVVVRARGLARPALEHPGRVGRRRPGGRHDAAHGSSPVRVRRQRSAGSSTWVTRAPVAHQHAVALDVGLAEVHVAAEDRRAVRAGRPRRRSARQRKERSFAVEPGGERLLRAAARSGARRAAGAAGDAPPPHPADEPEGRGEARGRAASCRLLDLHQVSVRIPDEEPVPAPRGRVGRRQHLGAAAAASSAWTARQSADLEHEHRVGRPPDPSGATIVTPGPVLGRVALLGERQAHPRAAEARVGRVVVAAPRARSPAGRGRRRPSGRPAPRRG